ncbi:carboxylic ester hydrolase-like [Periplaneta americana]|uniref:carboxylic ester hydrolase-like n=1 Tax=Periplaneta americana TaxID=6978 RepID=UPI0037E9B72B
MKHVLLCSFLQIYLSFIFPLRFVESYDSCCDFQPVKVLVNKGVIEGTYFYSKEGKCYCAFMGIPYAQPPVNHLRFKAPHKLLPWSGVLEAKHDAEDCISISPISSRVSGSEDCLYLNVYTPQIKPYGGTLLDVMVWFHDGEFYRGSAGFKMNNPLYLMDQDIVVVAPNYRLGAFGFLSTGDDEAPGNYGMKDQVAALRWVQDNIEAFGGNPKSVTIMGYGAGGASVHYHMLSPLTVGLFHRAISMEGTIFMPWARNDNPLQTAQKQAHILGCSTESTASLVTCMRMLPADVIVKSMIKMFDIWLVPSTGFTPVVEHGSRYNPEPFISDDPLDLIVNGSYQNVPWLMGSTNNGISDYMPSFFTFKVLRMLLKSHCPKILPKLLMLPSSVKNDIVQRIKHYYLTDSEDLCDNDGKLLEVLSHRHLIHGLHKAALLHSVTGHWPIYKYNFAYKGRIFVPERLTTLKNNGVEHGDDLMYLFPLEGNVLSMSQNDEEVQKVVITLWTNFMKYSNPTPPKFNDSSGLLQDLLWEPIGEITKDNVHLRYLNIGQVETSSVSSQFLNLFLGPFRLQMALSHFNEQMQFWDSLPLRENVQCDVCVKVKSGTCTKKFHITFIVLCLSALYLS